MTGFENELANSASEIEEFRITINEIESNQIDHRDRPYTLPPGVPELIIVVNRIDFELNELREAFRAEKKVLKVLQKKFQGVDEKLSLVIDRMQKDMIQLKSTRSLSK